jgi:hypothetical protein
MLPLSNISKTIQWQLSQKIAVSGQSVREVLYSANQLQREAYSDRQTCQLHISLLETCSMVSCLNITPLHVLAFPLPIYLYRIGYGGPIDIVDTVAAILLVLPNVSRCRIDSAGGRFIRPL